MEALTTFLLFAWCLQIWFGIKRKSWKGAGPVSLICLVLSTILVLPAWWQDLHPVIPAIPLDDRGPRFSDTVAAMLFFAWLFGLTGLMGTLLGMFPSSVKKAEETNGHASSRD